MRCRVLLVRSATSRMLECRRSLGAGFEEPSRWAGWLPMLKHLGDALVDEVVSRFRASIEPGSMVSARSAAGRSQISR